MKKNKKKEGLARKSSGSQSGSHAVAMATSMATVRARPRLRASCRHCRPQRPASLRVPDYSKQSLDLIRLRLVEAVQVLYCLPLTARDRPPRTIASNMPDVVRQTWESYGWDKFAAPRPTATMEQITRMEEAVQWLLWITDIKERTAVWVMAHRLPRSKVARKMRCNRVTVYRWELAGLKKIAHRLKK